jgi:nucleotide-binding universal stress UspA family protein
VYKKILVPLDGSELSELSLAHVKKVAAASNMPEVVLLYVLEPISILVYASTTLREDTIHNIEKQSQVHTQEYLDKTADSLKKEGLNVRGLVIWGRPADEILKYTKENQIDLIIMSTHGRSGISQWAFGSVADKVMRHSTVPVLTIRPPNFGDNEPQSH